MIRARSASMIDCQHLTTSCAPDCPRQSQSRTEFGAKMSVSLVNGYTLMEKLGWDNYNEGTTLRKFAKKYKQRFGCYPEAFLANQIYRTR